MRSATSVRASEHTAATKPSAINAQLATGQVEVNLGAMSSEEILEFVEKLWRRAPQVKSLRLLCMLKGAAAQYKYDAQHDSRARRRFILHSAFHRDVVDQTSAAVQHKRVRFKLYSALLDVLLQSDVTNLELGMRLSPGGYKVLSAALARNTTLRRLSFAGSHMGDKAVQLLREGLEENNSLEELDLTACNISDAGAECIADVVKRHADRRVILAFHRHLREYPDISCDPAAARTAHQRALRAAAREVDAQCGGLMHIELAENKVTDQGARGLCAALAYDRRLVLLSLRANALTAGAEAEFVELMRDHRALLRVDLRQNPDPKLGILKLRKPRVPPTFTAALGFQPRPNRGRPPMSPTQTEHSAALWELLDSASLAGLSIAGSSCMGSVSTSPGVGVAAAPGSDAATTAAGTATVLEQEEEMYSRMLMQRLSWGDRALLAQQLQLPRSSHAGQIAGWAAQLLSPPHSPKQPAKTGGAPRGSGNLLSKPALKNTWSIDEGNEEGEDDGQAASAQAPVDAGGAAVVAEGALALDKDAEAQPAADSKQEGGGGVGGPPTAGTAAEVTLKYPPMAEGGTGRREKGAPAGEEVGRPGTAGSYVSMLGELSSSPLAPGGIFGDARERGPQRGGGWTTGQPRRAGAGAKRGAGRSPPRLRRRPGGRGGGGGAGPSRRGKRDKSGRAARRSSWFLDDMPIVGSGADLAAQAAAAATQAEAAAAAAAAGSAATAAAGAGFAEADLQVVEELALMFRELELAVSSLELLYELHRGEPKQAQQAQQQQCQHVGQALWYPHGRSSPVQQRAWQGVQGMQGAQLQGGAVPSGVQESLQRWRELCDDVLNVDTEEERG